MGNLFAERFFSLSGGGGIRWIHNSREPGIRARHNLNIITVRAILQMWQPGDAYFFSGSVEAHIPYRCVAPFGQCVVYDYMAAHFTPLFEIMGRAQNREERLSRQYTRCRLTADTRTWSSKGARAFSSQRSTGSDEAWICERQPFFIGVTLRSPPGEQAVLASVGRLC